MNVNVAIMSFEVVMISEIAQWEDLTEQPKPT